jgi:phosphate:Na+ symporter
MKEIIIPFAMGIIIFLFGLQLMRIGLNYFAKERLQTVLLSFTKTPLRSFFTGIVSTAILQSSSAVTVLTISFVNAGVLTFTQSIGIILGTNIGSTVTTEILALKMENFAIPLIIVGAILHFLPSKPVAQLGLALGGFGCIFLGIETMKWITQPLKEHGFIFSWLLQSNTNPILIGIIIGTLITALIHSSSATIAITMSFYTSNLITLPFAIAVVFGSNIGTCITALLATFNTNIAAKQVALAHIMLNVLGVAVFTPFIPIISQYAPMLSTNPATQIAHIQTLFNILCSIAILPFTSLFARTIMFVIPYKN